MRSKLFVPGSRPELFPKAMAGTADAISIDLEDAVAPTRKAEARDTVAAFLPTVAAARSKVVIVRVNGLRTPHFEADVAAVARDGLDLLNVPKLESAEEVLEAAAALDAAERASQHPPSRPVGLLLNIESPRGLRNAAAIACAHPRVAGLQIGAMVAFSIITETVFQWPGLGLLIIQAITFSDVPVIAAYLLLIALLFVLINTVVDLLYFAVDPRLRTTR